MGLRLPRLRTNLLEAKVGTEGVGEIQEIMIYALMPENVRRVVTLTTPALEARIGSEATQDLRDWVQSVMTTELQRYRG